MYPQVHLRMCNRVGDGVVDELVLQVRCKGVVVCVLFGMLSIVFLSGVLGELRSVDARKVKGVVLFGCFGLLSFIGGVGFQREAFVCECTSIGGTCLSILSYSILQASQGATGKLFICIQLSCWFTLQ